MKEVICIFKGHKWTFHAGKTKGTNIQRTLTDLHNLEWQGFRENVEAFYCERCGETKTTIKNIHEV